jgi:hypothetical protein
MCAGACALKLKWTTMQLNVIELQRRLHSQPAQPEAMTTAPAAVFAAPQGCRVPCRSGSGPVGRAMQNSGAPLALEAPVQPQRRTSSRPSLTYR